MHSNFFIMYKHLIQFYFQKILLFKKIIFKKFKHSKLVFNLNHYKNLLRKIYHQRNIFLKDIPKYMEMDFFSLSIFILHNPLFLNDYNFYNLLTLHTGYQMIF